MELIGYPERRDALHKTLLDEENLARTLDLQTLGDLIKRCRSSLTREAFRVVVIGEFSRGKSTFINAMMGHRILPSSKKPTTSIISKIVYSDTPHYTLRYHDGTSRAVTEEEFLMIKAQNDKPEGEKKGVLSGIKRFLKKPSRPPAPYLQSENIAEAEIAYPLDFCRNQVEVIDTPGTNDLNVMRVEITYNYLKNADAAILVLSATQPLSKSEVDFLKERVLANQIQDIFVVVNYKDQLTSPDEEARVLRHVQDNLYEITRRKLPIFLVSSLQALYWRRKEAGEALTARQELGLPENIEVTGFPAFEKALSHFLSEEKGRAKLHRYATQGIQVLKQIDETLTLQREMSSRSLDEVRAELQALRPRFQNTQEKAIAIVHETEDRLQTSKRDIENACSSLYQDIRQAAESVADDFDEDDTAEDIKDRILYRTNAPQRRFVEEMSRRQQGAIDRELNRATHELQKLWKDLELGSTLDHLSMGDLSMDIHIDLSVDSGSSGGGGFLAVIGGIVGGIVAGPIGALVGGFLGLFFGSSDEEDEEEKRRRRQEEARRKQRNKVRHEIASQYRSRYNEVRDRVMHTYDDNVREICDAMRQTVKGRIADMERQLQRNIDDREAQQAEKTKIRARIDQQTHTARSLRSSLDEMRQA